MTDDELGELLKSLQPPERSYVQKLLDSALGALVTAVTIGFFALLWNSTRTSDTEISKLQTTASQIQTTLDGVQQTFKTEIGDLSARLELQSSLKDAVVAQNAAILALQQRVAALEQRPPAGGSPTPSPVQATNRLPLELRPVESLSAPVLLEKIRSKEDSIDRRIRQYEQRPAPRP